MYFKYCRIESVKCPVWDPGLTKKLPKDIERVQKRCLKLLYPSISYSDALCMSSLDRLDDRRDMIHRKYSEK